MNDLEELRSTIDSLLEEINKVAAETEAAFNRFQVALTGTLRLLDSTETTTLAALQGDPKDLKGYPITMISELQKKTQNSLRLLSQSTSQILKMIDEGDRKH